MSQKPVFTGTSLNSKKTSVPVEKAKEPFSHLISSALLRTDDEPVRTSRTNGDCDTSPGTHRWLRAVLREDVVPLIVVLARARLERIDMNELWVVIKQSAIQISGVAGTRYLKWPKTVWNVSKAYNYKKISLIDKSSIKAAMAALKLDGDERVVCCACRYSNVTNKETCRGGWPEQTLQPIRCSFFQKAEG